MKMQNADLKVVDESNEKHDTKLYLDTYMNYIAFSNYLFGKDTPIYDINEMASDNKFYQDARNMAEQLGIDWKTMLHEDSNRIMLAMLEDYYIAMSKIAEKPNLVIQVTLKILKNEQGKTRKTKRRTRNDK